VKETDIAARYAKALFLQASSLDERRDLAIRLASLKSLYLQNKELSLFLSSPSIALDEKRKAIEKVFSKTPLLIPFLMLLIDKGRTGLLPMVADKYQGYIDEEEGIIRGAFIHAGSFDEEWLWHMKKKFEELFNKKVILEEKKDPRLIKGGVIEAKGRQLDFSLKRQLEEMQSQLMGVRG
jgi:F-type H+-transporting ATPase subunit delta